MDLVAQENKILKKTIDDLISIEQGIYPQSIQGGGETNYKKRTSYMNGWNDALIEHMEIVCKVLDKNGIKVYDDKVEIKIL